MPGSKTTFDLIDFKCRDKNRQNTVQNIVLVFCRRESGKVWSNMGVSKFNCIFTFAQLRFQMASEDLEYRVRVDYFYELK